MYRISKNTRKYSTTPIVEVCVDANGKETEEIVAVITLTKKLGDPLSEKIVDLLNERKELRQILFDFYQDRLCNERRGFANSTIYEHVDKFMDNNNLK